MASYFGLYYPYIEFRDEGWLKLAALYWDRLYRMVPDKLIPSDSAEVRKLVAAEFIDNAHPGRVAHRIEGPFCDLLRVHGGRLRRSFQVRKTMPWDALDHIHSEKIGHGVINGLIERKLARLQGEWLGMHPRVAHVYMTALAEAMAPTVGARPIAEETAHHIAVSGLTMERLAAELLDEPKQPPGAAEPELEMKMVSLAINYVRPAQPEEISADDIIAFRKVHAAERDQFQREVSTLIAGLPHLKHVESPKDLQKHLEVEYDKKLRPKIARLEEAMRDQGWETANSVAAASFALPSGVAAALHLVGLTATGAVGGALGVAFSAWNIWRKHDKAQREALRPSPEAYLYRIGRKFTPRSTANAISVDSKRFLP